MRRAFFLLTLMAAIVFASAGVVLAQQGGSTTPSEDSPSFRGQNGEQRAPGKLIVKVREEATSEDLEELNRRNGASTDKQIAPNLAPGLHRVSLPRGLAVREAVGRYESNREVIEYAEPDFLRFASNTPTDPYYKNGSLWGLNNTSTSTADIAAPEVWDQTTGNTSNPIVAVIDEGVDIYHPDLQANIWVNQKEKNGVSRKDDDGNGKVDDINGWNAYKNSPKVYEGRQDDHGTHVAGTIGAVGNNGTGVTGVNWQTDIMGCKFMGSAGGYTSDAIECLDYVTVSGAKVSNNSWGGGGYSQALYDTIKKAGTNYGHIFVAAASNEGTNNDSTPVYPSSYGADDAATSSTYKTTATPNGFAPLDNVISVAATDKSDAKSSFSNYGLKSVDLGAPGSGIYSTLPEKGYGSYSGTSMATPHVTGTVGLVWAKNSGLTPTQVKSLILNNVDRISSMDQKTVSAGRLNAYKAVNATPTP